jgi:hypothetical protein
VPVLLPLRLRWVSCGLAFSKSLLFSDQGLLVVEEFRITLREFITSYCLFVWTAPFTGSCLVKQVSQ